MKKILTMVAVCLMAAAAFAAQCAATTKKGTQCKRQASPGSEFCWQHGGTTKGERGEGRSASRAEPVTPRPAPQPTVETETASESQCAATTKSGAQCKRKAVQGGKYCAQHAAKNGEAVASSDEPAAKPTRRRAPKTDAEAAPVAAAPATAAESGMCAATTKSGAPCKRKAVQGGKYCAQHAAKNGEAAASSDEPAAKPKRRKAKAKAAADDTPPASEASAAGGGTCQGKLKSGEPCKRKAKPGSNFCWQHDK